MSGSKLTILLAVIALGLYREATAGHTDHVTTTDVSNKIASMETAINSLVKQSQETENALLAAKTQLGDMKAQNAMITVQLQQANEQIRKLQQDKTTLTQINTTLQHLRSQLQQQASDLKAVRESEAALKAKQSLVDRTNAELELKIKKLEQSVTTLTARIKVVPDTNPSANLKQVAWISTHGHATDNGEIKSVPYIKKGTVSGLRVSFYGVLMVRNKAQQHACSRWWFELNGSECSSPDKIESAIFSFEPGTYFSPNVVSGICYGIPAGYVKVVFKVGKCIDYSAGTEYPLADAETGWNSASRIIIEEV